MADETRPPLPAEVSREQLLAALALLGLGDHAEDIRSMSIHWNRINLDVAVPVPGVKGAYRVGPDKELLTVYQQIPIVGPRAERIGEEALRDRGETTEEKP